MVNKKNRRLCADDPNHTFTECARQKLPEVLKNNSIDCVTSFWKSLQEYSNLTFCDINATRARQVMFFNSFFFQKSIFLVTYSQLPIIHTCPYKCFYTHFLDRTVRYLSVEKKITKLDFLPNRFGNFGIVWNVYLKIKRNFPNNMYNMMNIYNRKVLSTQYFLNHEFCHI